MIRVLVVDDDFMVARIHVGFVERVDGFEVVGVAHSGADAADAVARLRPDLLLLDLYLPDRFGLDLLADLRAGPHPCDAIVITAAKEGDAVRAAVRLGVADYLLVDSQGATEGAVRGEAAEAIADITSTGETLRANGLKVLSDGLIHASQATLFRSKGATWGEAETAALRRLRELLKT